MRQIKRVLGVATSFVELLESRRLLSGIATTTVIAAPAAIELGQNITVTANVTDTNGSPVTSGTVDLLNNGTPTDLSAQVNSDGTATFTFNAGNALYAGNYSLTGQYLGTTADAGSTSIAANLAITLPSFTTNGDGLQVATVTPGSGPGAVTGQTVTALYTGFYTGSGAEFDESAAHPPGTFSWVLNASPEQVITGFDEGATGIEVGETRVLVIPSALGYNDAMVRTFVVQSVPADTVEIGSSAQLSVAQEPATVATGTAVTPPILVGVQDANGNLVSDDTSNVTVSIASGPTGATLAGTTTVAASGGVATFSDLTFSLPGTYTLTATDGGLTSTTTGQITVTGAPVASVSPITPTLNKVSLPASAVAGGKLSAKVPVVLVNSGSVVDETVTINIYADMASTLDGNEVLLTSTAKKFLFKTNKNYPTTFDIKSLPLNLSAGTYHLLAEVIDPSGDSSLTATSQTVTVAAPFVQPSVTATSVIPASIAVGKSGSISVTLTNAGNVTGSGISIALALSADGTTQVPGITLDTFRSSAAITAGKTKKFKLHFKITNTFAVGSYFPYLTATLDGVSTAFISDTAFAISG